MHIIRHSQQKEWKLDRITHRNLITSETGSQQMEIWEQFMPPKGHTPLHYHEVEEAITILDGTLTATIGDESFEAEAFTTLFIPAKVVHGFRNQRSKTAHLIAFFPEVNPKVYKPDGTVAKRPWQDRG